VSFTLFVTINAEFINYGLPEIGIVVLM